MEIIALLIGGFNAYLLPQIDFGGYTIDKEDTAGTFHTSWGDGTASAKRDSVFPGIFMGLRGETGFSPNAFLNILLNIDFSFSQTSYNVYLDYNTPIPYYGSGNLTLTYPYIHTHLGIGPILKAGYRYVYVKFGFSLVNHWITPVLNKSYIMDNIVDIILSQKISFDTSPRHCIGEDFLFGFDFYPFKTSRLAIVISPSINFYTIPTDTLPPPTSWTNLNLSVGIQVY